MPRPRAFRTQVLQRVWDELRFAPAATLARMVADAEEFAGQVDVAQGYPDDLVVARVTRYRPDSNRIGDIVVGSALVQDLATFVERASARAPLELSARGGALTLVDAAQLMGISRATLQRYRKRGLMCHHVWVEAGAPRASGRELRPELRVFQDSIDAFMNRHGEAEAGAGLGAGADADAVAGASAGAARGAPVTPRRKVTKRKAPARARRARAPDRASAFAARAWQLGASPQQLAERAATRDETPGAANGAPRNGRSAPSVAACTRAVQRGRWRLAAHALEMAHALVLPTFERADSNLTLLAPPAVCKGLPTGRWVMPAPHLGPGAAPTGRRARATTHAPAHAHSHAHAHAPAHPRTATHDANTAQVVAHHYLLWRAGQALKGRSRPVPDALDRAECDLRWAYRLRRAVVEAALPDALARVAQHLGVPWSRLPEDLQWRWAGAAARAMADALELRTLSSVGIDEVHASRAAALAVERMLSRPDLNAHIGRTPPFIGASTVAPWMVHLESGDRWHALLPLVQPDLARFTARRFGLDGQPPATIKELAPLVPGSAAAAQARLYAALSALRAVARSARD